MGTNKFLNVDIGNCKWKQCSGRVAFRQEWHQDK